MLSCRSNEILCLLVYSTHALTPKSNISDVQWRCFAFATLQWQPTAVYVFCQQSVCLSVCVCGGGNSCRGLRLAGSRNGRHPLWAFLRAKHFHLRKPLQRRTCSIAVWTLWIVKTRSSQEQGFQMDERAFFTVFVTGRSRVWHSLAVDVIQSFADINAVKTSRVFVCLPDSPMLFLSSVCLSAVRWSSLPVLLWWSKFWVMVLFQGAADELLMRHWKTYSNSECTLGDAHCLTFLTKYQLT